MARRNIVKPPITKIYALINPINCTVFYVGATKQPLPVRLSGHINDKEKAPGANLHKIKIIKELKAKGLRPLIEELEECTGYLASMQAERFWIYQYEVVFGHKLANGTSRSFLKSRQKIISGKPLTTRVYW